MKATACESKGFYSSLYWLRKKPTTHACTASLGRILITYDSQETQLFCQCATKRRVAHISMLLNGIYFKISHKVLIRSTTEAEVESSDLNEAEIRDADASLNLPREEDLLREEDLARILAAT